MNSDENVTWSKEEIEEWEHDKWLRKEAMHYADLGDIQQNIFCLINKITFCYGFFSTFQECLVGVERRYRKKSTQLHFLL